ncbi:PWWP domain-containing DNA repair factor 3A-like isoform X1 [Erpetoichthys calabaricus]|uniref:PWWP domain-containing DNA repair factor 3A-like isoform X1 n=1 Tax=Erpetoichthys calabaricus TaxID=27687 RepID=UPI0022341312|nr:PWWP domain-containing DNA repair factor 3A-like isoform X1 [Erpetoichthys calabaricus]
MYSEKLLRSHPTGVFVVIHRVILTVSTVFQCVHFSEKTQLFRPKPDSLHKTNTTCDSLMHLFVCVHSVGEQAGCVAAVGQLTEEQVAQVFAAAEISRAYMRTQHEKLLEFIIKDHGADDHLLAVVSRTVSSKWLKNYGNPKGHRVMTYIEDEELIDGLYNFLDEVVSRAVGTFERIDRGRIILDVLMPEALIKAIQTVERISLPEAENLFMDGPVYSECEREEFDKLVLQQLDAQGKHH